MNLAEMAELGVSETVDRGVASLQQTFAEEGRGRAAVLEGARMIVELGIVGAALVSEHLQQVREHRLVTSFVPLDNRDDM